MEQQNIQLRVVNLVAEKLDVYIDHSGMTQKLIYDLGADSIDLIEITMELERQFGIDVPDELINREMTVKDFVTIVDKLLHEKPTKLVHLFQK